MEMTIEQKRAVALASARLRLQQQSGNQPAPDVKDAMAERDKYYSSGIYAGDYNPLGTIARSVDAFASGAQRAPMLGWDDEAAAALNTAGGTMGNYDEARRRFEADKLGQRESNPVASTAGEIAGSAVLAGNAPSFAGKAIEAGKSLPRVAFASGMDSAILGGVAGAGESDPGERLENAAYGFGGGMLMGAALPVAVAGVGAAARKVVSPFITSPERLAAADILRGEGVGLTAGQRTGSDRLRYAESELGGKAGADMMERQGEQFTAAALRRVGTTADRATPEVIDDTFSRIGRDFDGLAQRNKLLPDRQLENDLLGTAREYVSLVPESHRAPIVRDTLQDLTGALSKGPLDGETYQAVRSRIDRAARSSVLDPQLSDALHGIRNSLDDAMERSIATSNPGDVGAWREARRQYRNMLTIERAITGAGENAANGLISPSALRGATVAKQGRRNYARGLGDFAELARAGEATMKPLPNSGTAGRLNAQNLGSTVTTALGLGAAGYGSGGDPATMIAGAAAGYALPRAAGRVLMSGPAQRYLGNQASQNMQLTPKARAILNKLLGIEAADDASNVGRLVVGMGR